MSSPILSCKNLCKSYKNGIPVLHNLSIDIMPGNIVGLLGPNGCGKTTFIKLVSGLLVADSGELIIDGHPRSEESNAVIAYLPERTYLDNSMTVAEVIDYFEDFFTDFDRSIAERMLADLHIDSASSMKSLSKGTKEKVQLILVMARRAKIYLLDEPIAGVDPAAREYILKTIIGNYNPDAAVIITTHLISDVEPILDNFFFMGFGGTVMLSGSADSVRAEQGKSLDELFREVFRCSANY